MLKGTHHSTKEHAALVPDHGCFRIECLRKHQHPGSHTDHDFALRGNADRCNVSGNDECEGRGRWNNLRNDKKIRIEDNGGKEFRKHDLALGTFDAGSNTCTFSEDIAMKSSARHRIYVGELGPFDITRTTLENQNWAATLEFND